MKLLIGVAATVLLIAPASYGESPTILLDPQTGTLRFLMPTVGPRHTEDHDYEDLQTRKQLESIDRSLKTLAEQRPADTMQERVQEILEYKGCIYGCPPSHY